MNPAAYILVAIAQLLWPQPGEVRFEDLPPTVQKAIETECENYGQFDGVVFERHAEIEYREAREKYIQSGRNYNQQFGYYEDYTKTRESEAWQIGTNKSVLSNPPFLWTVHGADGLNPYLYLGEGHYQFAHCSAKITQKLPQGEALITFGLGRQLFHIFDIDDTLADGHTISEPGYLFKQPDLYEYTSAFGAHHSVISFHYISESEVEVSPQRLLDAVLAGEVSAYRFTFKRVRPTREQRDEGIEDVYEWRRTEAMPAVFKKLKLDAERAASEETP